MQVIPVLDLMGGNVVRAKMGDRDSYRPIESQLSRTPHPVEITHGLLSLAPFPVLYIADLDAIRRKGHNLHALARLKADFPDLELWIDNGAADNQAVKASRAFGVPVLGSESLRDLALVTSNRETLLSLDYRGDQFVGPQQILDRPDAWPDRVITMTLSRVGAEAGPDFERVKNVVALAGPRQVFAAGGVRNECDLVALEKAGATGVLVASALHDGRLTRENLMQGPTRATRPQPEP